MPRPDWLLPHVYLVDPEEGAPGQTPATNPAEVQRADCGCTPSYLNGGGYGILNVVLMIKT